MATVNFDRGATGRGGHVRVRAKADKPLLFITGTFDFDTSYPTGGELFTEVSGLFTTLLGVVFEQRTNRVVTYDYTNNKVLLQTALGTEAANASNQSSITGVRFIAWGYGAV